MCIKGGVREGAESFPEGADDLTGLMNFAGACSPRTETLPWQTPQRHQWTAQLEMTLTIWLPAILLLPPANSWMGFHAGSWENGRLHQWCPLFPTQLSDFISLPSW